MIASKKSPWEFRARAFIAFAIFFVGFYLGYAIDRAAGGHGTPTFVLIGRQFGQLGVRVAEWVIFGFTLLGFLLRWWGSSYHNTGVVYSSEIETGSLTAAGPYRYTRNPLYLGNLLQALGISAIGPPAATVIIMVAMTAFVYRLIFLEEAYLRDAQGEAYTRYCDAVPRLIPRLMPANIDAGTQKPDVRYGFVTELGTFGFVVWMAYLPIVDPPGPTQTFYELLYAAAALFAIGAVISRRTKRQQL